MSHLHVPLLAFLLTIVVSLSSTHKQVRSPERWRHFIHNVRVNATLKHQSDAHSMLYNRPPQPSYVEFTCTPERSPEKPTSAHMVRPGDIDVVGAVGDSITAAFALGADSIIDILREDRGESWCIGGDKNLEAEVITLPNILKKFNPALEGFSFGEADEDEPGARMNVAISGNEAQHMPANVEKLVKRMREDAGVNWDEDWKMITLLIGGNDLCGVCDDREFYSPDNYIGYIRLALNYLHANVPRAIVNVNTMFDVTQLPLFSDGIICDVIQDTVCYCAANKEHHALLQETLVAYNAKLTELVDSGKYDTRDDFTVVLQDHLRLATPPREPGTGNIDRSYWAEDCFHPGRKAHYAMGTSLWNTMLEPVGQKRSKITWEIGGKLACPTKENPYIFTRLNSPPVPTSTSGSQKMMVKKFVSSQGGQPHNQPGATSSGISIALIALGVALVAALIAVINVFVVRLRRSKMNKPDTEMYQNPAFINN